MNPTNGATGVIMPASLSRVAALKLGNRPKARPYGDRGLEFARRELAKRPGAIADCMAPGCQARKVCPVGAEHAYGPERANFIMRAFLRGQAAG